MLLEVAPIGTSKYWFCPFAQSRLRHTMPGTFVDLGPRIRAEECGLHRNLFVYSAPRACLTFPSSASSQKVALSPSTSQAPSQAVCSGSAPLSQHSLEKAFLCEAYTDMRGFLTSTPHLTPQVPAVWGMEVRLLTPKRTCVQPT